MTNIVNLLTDAYVKQDWTLVREAMILIVGEEKLDLPEIENTEPSVQDIVKQVMAQMQTREKQAAQPKASKKKQTNKPIVEEIIEDSDNVGDDDDGRVVNVIIKNKQNNMGLPPGPVGFKNGFNPTLVSSDVVAKEQKNNKKLSSKVLKEVRAPVKPKIVKCEKCDKKFDFNQVYPMGKITEESETRCHKCQIQR